MSNYWALKAVKARVCCTDRKSHTSKRFLEKFAASVGTFIPKTNKKIPAGLHWLVKDLLSNEKNSMSKTAETKRQNIMWPLCTRHDFYSHLIIVSSFFPLTVSHISLLSSLVPCLWAPLVTLYLSASGFLLEVKILFLENTLIIFNRTNLKIVCSFQLCSGINVYSSTQAACL